jgi:hypothetical protein
MQKMLKKEPRYFTTPGYLIRKGPYFLPFAAAFLAVAFTAGFAAFLATGFAAFLTTGFAAALTAGLAAAFLTTGFAADFAAGLVALVALLEAVTFFVTITHLSKVVGYNEYNKF